MSKPFPSAALVREQSRRRFLYSTGMLAAGATVGGSISPFLSGRAHAVFQPDDRAVVETTAGRIRGGIADGVRIFRGVPYGASTALEGRFMPPRPPERWSGVLDTLEYGDAWIAFARNGDPSHAELPAWLAYDTATRATMLFNDVCTVENDPGSAERLLWERIQERT